MTVARKLVRSGAPALPLRVDDHGATATTSWEGHLADLIVQVLTTAPGERVNRPEFGAGAAQALFAPLGPEVAATAQLVVHSSLQQWLADVVDVVGVSVTAEESTLSVSVTWAPRGTEEVRTSVVDVSAP